jgi:hypothetical protein
VAPAAAALPDLSGVDHMSAVDEGTAFRRKESETRADAAAVADCSFVVHRAAAS